MINKYYKLNGLPLPEKQGVGSSILPLATKRKKTSLMKIALLINGHLRDNPTACIQNAIDALNLYNNPTIDLYINTYKIIRTLYSNLSC